MHCVITASTPHTQWECEMHNKIEPGKGTKRKSKLNIYALESYVLITRYSDRTEHGSFGLLNTLHFFFFFFLRNVRRTQCNKRNTIIVWRGISIGIKTKHKKVSWNAPWFSVSIWNSNTLQNQHFVSVPFSCVIIIFIMIGAEEFFLPYQLKLV